MTYVKIKTDLARASNIKDFYNASEIKEDNKPYEFFLTEKDGVQIHAYKNRKDIYTIVFTSKDDKAIEEASFFSQDLSISRVEENHEDKREYFDSWDDLFNQIGSDEVGVGDFFGPLVVVSSFVENKDIDFLERLKINDSKKMTDDYIMKIGPTLKKRIRNYTLLVSPNKLSLLEENHFSMHKIMAKCHNQTHKGIIEKYDLSGEFIIYIDQFEKEETYKKYVADDLVSNPLYFRVNGETYYPSVAVSSVIARYTFLKEWQMMEEKLKTKIPKGASYQVDLVYSQLKKKFDQKILDQYVKRFFRNYKKD